MELESTIKQKIKKKLEGLGAYVFCPVQTGYGKRTVDMLICLNGSFLAIEVKRPKGVITEKQKVTLKEINEAGGVAIIAYSWDDVEKVIGEYDRFRK
jgi:hypothetical protein